VPPGDRRRFACRFQPFACVLADGFQHGETLLYDQIADRTLHQAGVDQNA